MNTIFDSLNEIITVINSTQADGESELQTIRRIISADFDGRAPSRSLQSYLDQIKEAFLAANQAFKLAARNQMSRILVELDPDRIASEGSGRGVGFGFMRKADHFDAYRIKFEQFKKWFESERFMEDLSREFERIYQKTYLEKGRTM